MSAWKLSAVELLDAYRSRTLSPVEAMRSTLERNEAVNPLINALFEVRGEAAMDQARASEARWSKGEPAGPLDGIPVTIKDSVAAEGWKYWRGTKARIGTVSDHDAPPTARLKDAGAIIFGKSTMPDFGLLASGVSSAHGVTRNPWDRSKNTGGSSSGAAAAVAAGVGSLTIGSDLGGSIRLPAAQCGLFGHKPTTGLVPHTPVSSLRVAGPLTRTVADAALLLSVVSRPDVRTSEPGGPTTSSVSPLSPEGLRLGLLLDMGYGPKVEDEVAQIVEDAARLIAAQGASLSNIAPPIDFDVSRDFDRLFSVRAAMERDELAPEKRVETIDFIGRYCDFGDAVSAKDYLQSATNMEKAKAQYAAGLSAYDFVLAPVLPMAGFDADVTGPNLDRPTVHVNFTAMVNQVGWPAASICCGFTRSGLPVGLQIIAAKGRDEAILGLAAYFETLRGFDYRFPDI
ncbi:amidase [Mesorhizobium sp. J428]|uniref:amidase n=1 Tax=Mesorhizobium sp. J428 TaxID=2898440 RepID=UPI002151D32E|nr:amidase [Mesorhizobium sp. J428]MCR5859400.1 amidase [Mesorhizobium sp. J428]